MLWTRLASSSVTQAGTSARKVPLPSLHPAGFSLLFQVQRFFPRGVLSEPLSRSGPWKQALTFSLHSIYPSLGFAWFFPFSFARLHTPLGLVPCWAALPGVVLALAQPHVRLGSYPSKSAMRPFISSPGRFFRSSAPCALGYLTSAALKPAALCILVGEKGGKEVKTREAHGKGWF